MIYDKRTYDRRYNHWYLINDIFRVRYILHTNISEIKENTKHFFKQKLQDFEKEIIR